MEELSDYAKRFAPGAEVSIGGKTFVITRSRRSKGLRLLKFGGVDTRDSAAALANQEIYVDAAELQPLPEGTYYHYDLIGMAVVTREGTTLGEVTQIIITGANDVLVVTGQGGEVLLPVIADVVKKIDAESRRISVELLPGLM